VGPTAVLEGGPARIDSGRYQIGAKAGDAVGKETMNGPMLRALLEERFRLKFHRETREVPIYTRWLSPRAASNSNRRAEGVALPGSIAALIAARRETLVWPTQGKQDFAPDQDRPARGDHGPVCPSSRPVWPHGD